MPVSIGGSGPYRFLLDTGSTHTAVTPRSPTPWRQARRPDGDAVCRRAAECLVVACRGLLPGPPWRGHHRHRAAASGRRRARPRRRRRARPGLPRALRLHHRLPAVTDRLAPAGFIPSGARLTLIPAQGRWLVELPQPGTARIGSRSAKPPATLGAPSGEPRALLRLVPDSGADTLVLFEEARARLPLGRMARRHRRARLAHGRAHGPDRDCRRPPGRRNHPRPPARGNRAGHRRCRAPRRRTGGRSRTRLRYRPGRSASAADTSGVAADADPASPTACCRCTCSPRVLQRPEPCLGD